MWRWPRSAGTSKHSPPADVPATGDTAVHGTPRPGVGRSAGVGTLRAMLPARLHDCADAGSPESELIVTEGEMAANAVLGVRDARTQAVLAMRGKVVNAITASADRVAASEPVRDLFAAMGCGAGDGCDPAAFRYGRLGVLMDGDVDGIHAAALLTILFDRYHGPLLHAGRVVLLKAPLFRIAGDGEQRYAYRDDDREAAVEELRQRGVEPLLTRFRSIAHMNPDELAERCVDPTTRYQGTLTVRHALAAAASYEQMRRMLRRATD